MSREDLPEDKRDYLVMEKSDQPSDGSVVQGSEQAAEDGREREKREQGEGGNSTAESPTVEEEEMKYISGLPLVAVTAGVTISTFLMLLDTSILATAIPRITNQFHSLPDIGWYVAAYQLSSATLQPLFGKIYHYFSSKRTYLTALALFEFGSLLCALAVSSRMLIVGRAVAGLGASGMYNGSLMILAGAVPLEKRPALTGVLMGVSQVGLIVGPMIGGSLTQYASWRWCFYINLPVGGLAFLVILLSRVPDQVAKSPALTVLRDRALWRKLDLTGAVLFAPAAVMLLLAMQYGGNRYAWGSSTVVGLFCGAGATFMLFLAWERRAGVDAMVPFEVATKMPIWTSCLGSIFLFVSIFTSSYFLPVYFQSILGVTPFLSGLYLLPSILSQLIFAVLSGYLIGKVGYYIPFSVFSGVVTAIGSGLISTMSPTTKTGEWIGYQIFQGAGRGAGMQNTMIAIQATTPPSQLSVAIAMLVFSQNLGAAIFITIANVIFDNSLRAEIAANAPGVDPQAVIAAGATAFRSVVPATALPAVLAAYAKSFDRTFYVAVGAAVGTFAAAWGMGWVDVRKKEKKIGGAAVVAEAAATEEQVA